MSKTEAAIRLYELCKDMDIEETLDLVLNAETQEQQDFFSMLSDFILQKKANESYCSENILKIFLDFL